MPARAWSAEPGAPHDAVTHDTAVRPLRDGPEACLSSSHAAPVRRRGGRLPSRRRPPRRTCARRPSRRPTAMQPASRSPGRRGGVRAHRRAATTGCNVPLVASAPASRRIALSPGSSTSSGSSRREIAARRDESRPAEQRERIVDRPALDDAVQVELNADRALEDPPREYGSHPSARPGPAKPGRRLHRARRSLGRSRARPVPHPPSDRPRPPSLHTPEERDGASLQARPRRRGSWRKRC